MKREQAVLRSLIVMVALMLTTTAFAQEQCRSTIPWSYGDPPNRTYSVDDIARLMNLVLNHVELVPPDEADHIRKELAKQNEKFDADGLKKLQGRRYFTNIRLRDAFAKVVQEVEAAKRATAQKDVASHLIEILYNTDLDDMAKLYMDEYAKRVPFVEGAKNVEGTNLAETFFNIFEARFVAATVLRCIVTGLSK